MTSRIRKRLLEQLEDRMLLHGMPVEITDSFSVEAEFSIPQQRRDETTLVNDATTAFVAELKDGSDAMLTLNGDAQIGELPIGTANEVGSNQLEHNGLIYFSAYDDVFVSDGTAANTVKLASGFDAHFQAFGDMVLFSLRWNNTNQWWVTDGTPEETRMISNVVGKSLVQTDDGIYFLDANRAGDVYRMTASLDSEELVFRTEFRSDLGMRGRVVDLFVVNDRVVLWERINGDNWKLWRLKDGPAAPVGGNELITDQISWAQHTQVLNDKLVFTGWTDGTEATRRLWVSEGTAETTHELGDMRPETTYYPADGYAVFWANDPAHGTELWRTDGTAAGTYMLNDINVGAGSTGTSLPSVEGQTVRFQARTTQNGLGLWSTDGTTTGTKRDVDLLPNRADQQERLLSPISIDGRYLLADSDSGLVNTWKIGSPEAIVHMENLIHADVNTVSFLTTHQGRWYFAALVHHFGWELWVSDGTAEGTIPVRETRSEYSRQVPRFVDTVGDRLIYAYDSRPNERGELWSTDGTQAGTQFLGATFTYDSRQLLAAYPEVKTNGQLIVALGIDNTDEGVIQWVTDGTANGTQPAILSETPFNMRTLAANGGVALVEGETRQNGKQLWRLNADADELQVVDGIVGSDDLVIGHDLVGDTVYLRTRGEVNGDFVYELWSYNLVTMESRRWFESTSEMSSVLGRGDGVVFGGTSSEGAGLFATDAVGNTPKLSDFATTPTPHGVDDQLILRTAGGQLYRQESDGGFVLISSSTQFVATTNDRVYYQGSDGDLYATDGFQQYRILRETTTDIRWLGEFGEQAIFATSRFDVGGSSFHGLYVTDGETSTELKTTTYSSPTSLDNSVFDDGLISGGRFYFNVSARDAGQVRHEIWSTDGTLAGTQRALVAPKTDELGIVRYLGGDLQDGFIFSQSGDVYFADTAQRTSMLLIDREDTPNSYSLSAVRFAEGSYYFHGVGGSLVVSDLYITDGSIEGTSTIELDGRVQQVGVIDDTMLAISGNQRSRIWQIELVGDETSYDDLVVTDNIGAYVAESSQSGMTPKRYSDWIPNVIHFGQGDLNGDGLDDIVGHAADGKVWVGLATDSSSFNVQQFGNLSPDITWTDFSVADFDGDGKDDVMVRADSDGSWWVLKSTGSSFSYQEVAKYDPIYDWKFVTGDFNQDGRQDIAGCAGTNGAWWVGISDGNLAPTSNWGSWGTDKAWSDFLVGDFSGDGLDDIAARADDSTWWVASSTGNGFSSTAWAGWNGTAWEHFTVGDYNNDGRDDIVGRAKTTGDWWMAESNGPSFSHRRWGKWPTYTNWHDVQEGDFNADGRSDLIGRADNGEWWILESTGTRFTGRFGANFGAFVEDAGTGNHGEPSDIGLIEGEFSEPVEIPFPEDELFADFDGNGEVDFSDFLILSTNFGEQDASHNEGDANGDGEVSFADFLILSTLFGATG